MKPPLFPFVLKCSTDGRQCWRLGPLRLKEMIVIASFVSLIMLGLIMNHRMSAVLTINLPAQVPTSQTATNHSPSAAMDLITAEVGESIASVVPEQHPLPLASKHQEAQLDQLPHSEQESLWMALHSARHTAHSISPNQASQTQNFGARYFMSNPRQHLTARFLDGAMRLGSGLGGEWTGTIRFKLNTSSTLAPPPKAKGDRVEYHHAGGVQEWYVNKTDGFEHGFTVASRLDAGSETLKLELSLEGLSTKSVPEGGDGLDFIDKVTGKSVARYSGLKAWDAGGHQLHSWLSASDGAISINVADVGAVYPITIDPLITSLEAKLEPSFNPDGFAADDQFGHSVALAGDTAIVGSYFDDTAAGSNVGSVYVFVKLGSVWQYQAKLTASDASAGKGLGTSVALDGDTALVGASGDNFGAGSAYVFVRNSASWSQQAKLTAGDAAADDFFGASVALSGGTALIGSFYDDSPLSNAGSAYVFVKNGSTWSHQAKLTASDAGPGDNFGSAVALSGGTALIGAVSGNSAINDTGSAYVFLQNSGSWNQQAKLTASDAAAYDGFGSSVALSGNIALIGAPLNDSPLNWSGSAYVFVQNGSAWSQQAKLTAGDAAASDRFGSSVALSGNTALIGAPLDASPSYEAGSAYVFLQNGSTWSQQAKLTAGDAAASDRFGTSVALSGNTALVGVPYDARSTGTPLSREGSAYLFDRIGATWTQQAKFDAGDDATGTGYGSSVSLSGNTLLVGAGFDGTASGYSAGSAHVLTKSGSVWSYQSTLFSPDARSGDMFGVSVSLEGDTAIIGADKADLPGKIDAGSAYVFIRSASVWTYQAKLTSADSAANDGFGADVSHTSDTAIIGAYKDNNFAGNGAGSVYAFVRSGNTWSQQAKLTPSDASAGKWFGASVAISGERVIIGGWNSDSGAYIFLRNGTSWNQEAKLTPSDSVSGDFFGYAVAISGDTALVGAYRDDFPGKADAGSAYVFTRSGSSWNQQAKLTASDSGVSDFFGSSVAIVNDTALIGAYHDSTAVGDYAGSAYVFVRNGAAWNQQVKIETPDAAADDWFGSSLALEGTTAIIGSPYDDTTDVTSGAQRLNHGSVYIYSLIMPEIAIQQPLGSDLMDGISAIDFGPIRVGSNSAAKTFIVRNTGDSNLTISGVGLSGPQMSNFNAATTGMLTVLSPGSSTSFTVSFSPSQAGALTASIDVLNDDLSESPFSILLNGTGITPEIVVEQLGGGLNNGGNSDFGIIPLSSSSNARNYTIRNTGSATMTISSVTKIGGNTGDFIISTVGMLNTLEPSMSTSFSVIFTPGAVGTRTTTLRIGSDDLDENPFNINLTGTGVTPEIVVEQPAGAALVDGESAIIYGAVLVGTGEVRAITIRNTGSGVLSGLSASLVGANAANFSLSSLGETTLAPGSSTTFTVTFTPSTSGIRLAGIQISNNDLDENPFDITLAGEGQILTPEIVVEQPEGTPLTDGVSAVDFGTVLVSTPGVQTFTIRNTGDGPLTGLALNKSGVHAGDYTLGTLGSTTIAPNGSTTFTVTFSPPSAGIRVATLLISSNDADESPFEVTLLGLGSTTAPEIVVEQPAGSGLVDGTASVDFGNALTGNSVSRTFTIRNTGDGALTGLAASVVGAQASDYTPGALGASSLAPGGSTTFDVIFSPTAAGARTTTLRIASNDANENPFDIALTGSGTLAAPEIVVEQPADTPLTDGLATVNHGVVQITGTSSRTYTLRNTGNALLTGLALSMTGANAGDFTPGALTSTTLAPAASMTFALTFSPLAGGSRTATLHIASNDADENPFDITVTGTGSLAAPDIAVEQAGGPLFEDGSVTVDYGVVAGGSMSSQTFTIRNTGNAPLTGLSLGKTGTHASDFTLGALSSTTLAQDASTTFTVIFSPGGGGIRTAALQITSDDADENPFDIALTGTAPIPGGNVADNFDDNVLNTAMWLKEDYTDEGTLTEVGKRLAYTCQIYLDYSVSGLPRPYGQGESRLTLIGSQPSSGEDWETVIDVTNSATSGSYYAWEAGAILEIYDTDINSGNRISLELGAFNSGTDEGTVPNQFGRTFVGGLMTDGVDDPDADDELPATGTNTAGVLRVAFNAATKVFTLSVDRSGPANGLQWETVATYGIAGTGGSRNAEWGMTDTGSFQIHLVGLSWDVAVTSGQVTFDNFKLTRSGVSPPAITQQPASRTIVSGQSTPLSVGTSGFPLSYQWYAGATGDTSQPIAGARGAIFTTPALTTQASYWVRVSNSLGSEDSDTAVISISASPLAPTFATQPLSQLAMLGQALTFNLTVTGSDPLIYQWRKGTTNISNAKSSILTLPPLKTSDAGLYSLRATNGVGTKDSNTAYLGIVTRGPTAVGVNIGTTLTLNAVVTVPAGTSARYRWHQDGVALSNGGRRSGVDTKTLKITGTVPTDAGNYTCQITMVTPAGDVEGNNGDTVVSVVEKPVFDAVDLASNFDDVRVGQGIDFTITADNAPTKFIITGLPPGVKLDAATGRIYGIPTAAKIVKGVITPYTLKISASNTAGTSDVETVLWTVQPLYPGVIGTYNGLVAHDPVNQDLGGTLKLTVASTAALSGTLKLGALSYTLVGSLNFPGINDTASGQIVIPRKAPLTTLVIALEINKDTGELTGSVADDDSGPAELTAWRMPWSSTNKADAYVATYNTALDPAGGDGPEGYGFMPVKVTNLGAVSWTGKLADGTGITGSTGLGPDGQIAFQHLLYTNTGSIQGWLTITKATGHLDGVVNWFKAEQPTKSTTRSYKGGFLNPAVTVIGAPYLKPAAAVLDLPTPDLLNAKVTLLCSNADAVFPVDAEHLFTITNKNVVTPDTPNDYAIKLSLAAATGTFSGSITLYDEDQTDEVEPIAILKRTVKYTGILVTREDFNQGAGYFIVDELPYMEEIPNTDPPRERRVTATPQWSGSATLQSVD